MVVLAPVLLPEKDPDAAPRESFRNIRLCGPGHITTTGAALYLTPKQAHVIQEQDSDGLVTEQVREKYLVVSGERRVSCRPSE
jgi:hypothetical protein